MNKKTNRREKHRETKNQTTKKQQPESTKPHHVCAAASIHCNVDGIIFLNITEFNDRYACDYMKSKLFEQIVHILTLIIVVATARSKTEFTKQQSIFFYIYSIAVGSECA